MLSLTAQEMKPHHITVNAYAPGPIVTPMCEFGFGTGDERWSFYAHWIADVRDCADKKYIEDGHGDVSVRASSFFSIGL